MRIAKSLLVIGLLASSLVYAGPAFEKAIRKGITDREKKYTGRIRMLALFLSTELVRLKSAILEDSLKMLSGDASGKEIVDQIQSIRDDVIIVATLIVENTETEGYKLANEAIEEIRKSEIKDEEDPRKDVINQKKNFEVVKGYYERLYDEISKNHKKLFGEVFVTLVSPTVFKDMDKLLAKY